jgi:hypothetical protein
MVDKRHSSTVLFRLHRRMARRRAVMKYLQGPVATARALLFHKKQSTTSLRCSYPTFCRQTYKPTQQAPLLSFVSLVWPGTHLRKIFGLRNYFCAKVLHSGMLFWLPWTITSGKMMRTTKGAGPHVDYLPNTLIIPTVIIQFRYTKKARTNGEIYFLDRLRRSSHEAARRVIQILENVIFTRIAHSGPAPLWPFQKLMISQATVCLQGFTNF